MVAVLRPVQTVEDRHRHVVARLIPAGAAIVEILVRILVHQLEGIRKLLRAGLPDAAVGREIEMLAAERPAGQSWIREAKPVEAGGRPAALLLLQRLLPVLDPMFGDVHVRFGADARGPAIAAVLAIQAVDQQRHGFGLLGQRPGSVAR